MIKTIDTAVNLNLATITIPQCAIAKGLITVDLHETNSIKDQAVFECFGDLLLSGTSTLTREELLDKLNLLGSSIDTHITDGVLTLEISSTQKSWKKTLELVNDILTNPIFTAKELKRATKLAFNNLNDEKENSKAIALDAFKNDFFSTSDRRSSAELQTVQTMLVKLTNKDIKEMFARMFTRPWVTSVTSDKPACLAFAKLVTKQTASIVTDTNFKPTSSTPPKPQKLVLNDIPSRQNLDIQIGCPIALKPGDAEFAALTFGVAVLAKWGGFAGRLMSIVREQEGLTYGIYGRLDGYSKVETGYFRIETFFSPAQVSQGLQSTFREIKRIYTRGITDAEYTSFKIIMETQLIMRNDSPVASIKILHEFNKLGFTIDQIEAYEAQLRSVTKTEVTSAIKKYLDPKQMIISAAGPTKQVTKELLALSTKL